MEWYRPTGRQPDMATKEVKHDQQEVSHTRVRDGFANGKTQHKDMDARDSALIFTTRATQLK